MTCETSTPSAVPSGSASTCVASATTPRIFGETRSVAQLARPRDRPRRDLTQEAAFLERPQNRAVSRAELRDHSSRVVGGGLEKERLQRVRVEVAMLARVRGEVLSRHVPHSARTAARRVSTHDAGVADPSASRMSPSAVRSHENPSAQAVAADRMASYRASSVTRDIAWVASANGSPAGASRPVPGRIESRTPGMS